MKLRYYFLILVLLLLPIMGFFAYHAAQIGVLYTLLAEGLLILICVYLGVYYRKVVTPLKIINRGMDLLAEQDFGSRLRKVGQYEADRVVEVFNKMMEELKNERLRVREQNEFLDLLIKASPMGVIILNHDQEIEQLNPAALRILKLDKETALHGKRLNDIKSQVALDLSELPLHTTEVRTLSDGRIYKCTAETFVDRGFYRNFYLIESLTEELRQAEKKAYEQVIRMISHEVNNTTAVIISTLDTMGEMLEGREGDEDLHEAAKVCGERCLSMSRFITRFAEVVKIPTAVPVPTSLNDRMESLRVFFEVMCHPLDIRLHYNLDAEMPCLEMDNGLMDQVFLNIVKNAVESIGSDGDIYISTEAATRSITIADTGRGIESSDAGKLFTPFFSTKPTGQGIGLLFVREVLKQHGCDYWLKTSEVDGLTRFCITFGARGFS